MVAYRPWNEHDLPAIQILLLETWLETYTPFIPENDLRTYHQSTYSLGALQSMLRDPSVRGFVAESDGVVVGCIRTKLAQDEKRFYVSSLYIHPRRQGQGIGRSLMTLAAKEAQVQGYDRIWLGVMEKNKHGVEWYKRYGFKIREEAPFAMGKTSVNHYIGDVPVKSFLPQ